MMPEKIGKKSLLHLAIIVVITILICVGFFYYLSLMSKIEMEEKISESREYIYQNKVTSESSSETCWINDEGKKECTATFGKHQWINDEGVFKNFTDVVNVSFDKSNGDLIYSYKEDYSVTVRLFLVVDVSQSLCEAQGWDWRSQDDACFLWWAQAKEFMEANGIDYDVIITKYPDRYKYALSLTKIPQNYQDKLLYVGLRLEEAKGLKWEDLKEQERSLTIKNKISLGFDDLIENGFTYKLYDERTILVGNVSNKENLWLDPIAEPATETSDGDIYGIASDYSTARGTSSDYSTSSSRMNIGQEYQGGGCTGTVIGDCSFYDASCDDWPNGEDDCNNEVIGCYWVGCTGTPDSCDSFGITEECNSVGGCSWVSEDCSGTAYSCGHWTDELNCTSSLTGCEWNGCTGSQTVPCSTETYQSDPDFCEFIGCSWDGCTGTADPCDTLSESDCEYQDDCEWIEEGYGSECTGTATPCDSYSDEVNCEDQLSCSWDGCTGPSSPSCSSFDSSVCDFILGCSWDGSCVGESHACVWWRYPTQVMCEYFGCDWNDDYCEGTATSCDSYDCSDDCENAGCFWLACQGTPTPCDELDEYDCESQYDCSWETGDYWVNRGYLSFDTSSIPPGATITDVELSLKADNDYSDDDFDVEIWKFNWSEPLGNSMEANYDAAGAVKDDAIWRNTSGMSTDVYYDSSSLDTSWINLTGDTKYQLRSEYDVNDSSPTGSEYIDVYSADSSAGNQPVLKVTYTVNTAPTWDSIGVTPDPVEGGSEITITAYGEDDLEDNALAIYCDESPNPSSDSGRYDVCSGTGFTSPYNVSCTGTALTGGTSYTVYCKLYDGTDYSTQKQDTYTVNQSPDKPTGLNESWGCCGGMPQVAFRTCLILSWSYSDPDGDSQAGYEVWVDDSLAGLAIEADLDPKFNNVVDPGSAPFYTVDLDADDEGDWLDPPPLPGGLVWANTYHWKVKAKDSNGGWSDFSDPKSFTLPDRASPKVDFTPNPINPRTGDEVTFIDDSKCYLSNDSEYDCKDEFEITGEDDISYEWDFDYKPTEGFTVDDTFEGDATYTYPETGKYTIRLQVTDSGVGLGPGMCYKEKTLGLPLPTWKEITPF